MVGGQMRVISIINQKGGVGKTTTAVIMAGILQKAGKKVLLIDTDPSGNASSLYGFRVEDLDGEYTLSDVIFGNKEDRCNIKEAIKHSSNGDIVPGDRILSEGDIMLGGKANGFVRLRNALRDLGDEYDYVIIDSTPTLNVISKSCIVASTDLIIPATPDNLGLEGVGYLQSTIDDIKDAYDTDIKVDGVLLTKFNRRTKIDTAGYDFMKKTAPEFLDSRLYTVPIRNSNDIKASQMRGIHLIDYKPKSLVTLDYMGFMSEFLDIGLNKLLKMCKVDIDIPKDDPYFKKLKGAR